jgi:SAM-dependent methyltransferase
MGEDGWFWDRRYREEGAIWGDGPSVTALLASQLLRPRSRVLDVGFGYGRDLTFLLREGHRACGIDLSAEGRRQAEARLRRAGVEAEWLRTGRFEDGELPGGPFDAVLSHRMAHLLLTPGEVRRFAARAWQVLRPGGVLAVAARDLRDLDPAEMVAVGEDVYEYRRRPGHRIRYWGTATFREAFGPGFAVEALTRATEGETAARPAPCRLTVLVGRKRADGAGGGPAEEERR